MLYEWEDIVTGVGSIGLGGMAYSQKEGYFPCDKLNLIETYMYGTGLQR